MPRGSRLQVPGSRQWPSACNRAPAAQASGFTLLEMLIALSLLAIIVSASVTVFRGLAQSWQRGEVRSLRYQNARAVFDVMTREISSILPPDRHAPLLGLSAAPPWKADATGPALFFVALVPGAAPTDVTEIGYWLRGRDHVLMRHLDTRPDFHFDTADADEPLGMQAIAWSLTYFDGTTWLDHWDSRAGALEAGRLPRAIRLHMTLQDTGGREQETFETTVSLPVAEP